MNRGDLVMRREETQVGINDLFLIVFILVAGWFLLFQANIF
jgi:hypothetical protein